MQRLIASTGGDSARDIRDRAILMLLATYAFRSGEVASLCLENLNWESEIISISRPKQRRAQEHPLVSQVGEAILRYLQQVRPRCARREIFLALKAPFRRLSQGALYHLISKRLGALGIQIPRRGPHCLRHYAGIAATPAPFIAWSPGIGKGQTCNACCHNWQLISAMFISLLHSVTLP